MSAFRTSDVNKQLQSDIRNLYINIYRKRARCDSFKIQSLKELSPGRRRKGEKEQEKEREIERESVKNM